MRINTDFSAKHLGLPNAPAVPESVQHFCGQQTPYLPDKSTDASFIEAMIDITRWHRQRSPWYRGLLATHGVQVERLSTMADLIALPPVHADFFKTHEVLSVPESEVTAHLISSGASGQKSQMFFDSFTMHGARRMVDDAMQARGVVSSRSTNYLVNAYEPYDGLRAGSSSTYQYLLRYAPASKVFWTLRAAGDGQHEFDAFGTLAALQDYAQDDRPTRIIGLPAYLHFALKRMEQLGMAPLKLPQGSCVIFGGGWKDHADQAISKEELQRNIAHWLGIPSESIVETFGSVEHSVPYVDCHLHRLHAPMWSRVVVRDVRSLKPVADGKPGFLSFLSPYISSVPAHSVVMGDMAIRHASSSCRCGRQTPWFEVLGRAGTARNQSCATPAEQALQLA